MRPAVRQAPSRSIPTPEAKGRRAFAQAQAFSVLKLESGASAGVEDRDLWRESVPERDRSRKPLGQRENAAGPNRCRAPIPAPFQSVDAGDDAPGAPGIGIVFGAERLPHHLFLATDAEEEEDAEADQAGRAGNDVRQK